MPTSQSQHVHVYLVSSLAQDSNILYSSMANDAWDQLWFNLVFIVQHLVHISRTYIQFKATEQNVQLVCLDTAHIISTCHSDIMAWKWTYNWHILFHYSIFHHFTGFPCLCIAFCWVYNKSMWVASHCCLAMKTWCSQTIIIKHILIAQCVSLVIWCWRHECHECHVKRFFH